MALNRPNILYVHSHDTGRYVQPYGYAVPTPHIQRLAEQGVLFRKAFCAGPTCSPSRASLLTGQWAHSNGMLGLAHRGFALYDYGHHLLHTLRKAGYSSALIGEEHISKQLNAVGYDQVLKVFPQDSCVEEHRAGAMAAAAIDLLERGQAQPFFFSVGFYETHRKFLPPSSTKEIKYSMPPTPLPDLPEMRADMAAFKASAGNLDRGVGAIVDAVKRLGLLENTLIIFTTDHGIAFPKMKCNLTDSGIGVSLMICGPGGFSGGRVCDALVSQIDLFPTLCDLLEIEHPDWLQGTSLLPLIRDEVEEIHDEIFAEVTYHAAYEPQRAVRTQRWKYIRRYDHMQGPVLPNCDDSPSKDILMRYGWGERPIASEQLYDLIFDPTETCNVAGEADARPILEEMRERLERWMQATEDPLLHGPVPAPSGVELNDQHQVSAEEPKHVV